MYFIFISSINFYVDVDILIVAALDGAKRSKGIFYGKQLIARTHLTTPIK
jgi:hypothetical protein